LALLVFQNLGHVGNTVLLHTGFSKDVNRASWDACILTEILHR
jgi:hypothetical protein